MLLCERETCVNGNCPGCKDGKRWCDDPRCSPYCTGCKPPKQNFELVNIMFALFVFILILGVFISLYFYGPRFVIVHPGKYDSSMEIVDGDIMI